MAVTLPRGSEQHRSWNAISAEEAAPTERQAAVMRAVAKVLAGGAFYSNEVREKTLAELGRAFFTEEDLALDVGHVEGGRVGMEVYYARQAVEVHAERAANRAALVALRAKGFAAGASFRDLEMGGHRFSTAVVESIDEKDALVTLLCTKRGSRSRWKVGLGAAHALFRAGARAA